MSEERHRSVVVGTAGHIDHGKSALVRALTGTDPDRLDEERARGITIDLGFAHSSAADGTILSFVDVPGHERFVKTMLAGAAGVDVVLLVVAADESVMPQTREHLDICRLLDVRAGVVALSKCDLADEETRELVRLELADVVEGTFLEDAAVVACSAVDGTGLDELREALAAAAATAAARPADGPLRLPVDRAFTLKGFGAVVTGTAACGSVAPGDDVEILPGGASARVRSVEVHGHAAEEGRAGERVALNLGGIEHSDLSRGDVVVEPGSLVAARTVDVELALLDDAPEQADLARVRVHLGTAEVLARVRWEEGRAVGPGERALAQLRLESPIVAAVGDRLVLRRYSPIRTIGGGRVLHPAPPHRLKRRSGELLDGMRRTAEALAAGDAAAVAVELVTRAGRRPVGESDLGAWTGRRAADVRGLLAAAEEDGRVVAVAREPRRWLAGSVVGEAAARVEAHLAELHRREPLKPGEAKQALAAVARLPRELLGALLERMEAEGRIRVERDLVAAADHSVQLTPDEQRAHDALVEAHRAAGVSPPNLPDALTEAGLSGEKAKRIVHLLLSSGELVRLKDGLLVHGEALAALLEDMASWYETGESFSVPDFKSRSGVSRKHAIPLLEMLDQQGYTRRAGEGRIWTGRPRLRAGGGRGAEEQAT